MRVLSIKQTVLLGALPLVTHILLLLLYFLQISSMDDCLAILSRLVLPAGAKLCAYQL